MRRMYSKNQLLELINSVVEELSFMENPMTTAQDLIVGGTDGAPSRLAKGTDGQVLKIVSGAVAWANETGGMTNPMTTAQDLIVGGTDGAPSRLGKGTDGQVLKMVSGAVAWANESGGGGGMTNPMTTAGDIIVGGASGTPSRLGVGTDGQVLKLVSGAPAWANESGGGGTVYIHDINLVSTSYSMQISFKLKMNTSTKFTSVADLCTYLQTNMPNPNICPVTGIVRKSGTNYLNIGEIIGVGGYQASRFVVQYSFAKFTYTTNGTDITITPTLNLGVSSDDVGSSSSYGSYTISDIVYQETILS